MIACAEAVRQLWEYLDGLVDAPDRQAVEEHLAFCHRCCGELEFAGELRRLLAGPVAEALPSEVERRLMDTLRGLGR